MAPNTKVSLGEKIACLRQQHQLSQSDLGNLLFVSNKTISKWECNRGLPDLEILVQLAQIFQVSLDDLLQGTHTQLAGSIKVSNQLYRQKQRAVRRYRLLLGSALLVTVALLVGAFVANLFSVNRYLAANSDDQESALLIWMMLLVFSFSWLVFAVVNTVSGITLLASNSLTRSASRAWVVLICQIIFSLTDLFLLGLLIPSYLEAVPVVVALAFGGWVVLVTTCIIASICVVKIREINQKGNLLSVKE